MTSKIKLNTQIRDFVNFLNSVWPSLDRLMEDHDWEDDIYFIEEWIQSNWEFLVERELFHGDRFISSLSRYVNDRVTKKNANINYIIVVKITQSTVDLGGQEIEEGAVLRLGWFQSKIEGGIGLYPPFDLACLIFEQPKPRVFVLPTEKITFELLPIEEYPGQLEYLT